MAETPAPEIYVTNFNKRFTGVSSTARAVMAQHMGRYRVALVGVGLHGLPDPLGKIQALRMSRRRPEGRPFAIWHVRRNSEMQLAIFARDVLRLPIRIVFTSAAKRRHSAWPRWLIGRMDAVIATTDAAARFVPNVVGVVPNGVDTERFIPAPDRRAAWARTGFPGDYGILAVGRIRPEKGTDLFVRAMISILPSLPGATAVVVGATRSRDVSFLRGLQAQISEAGLRERFLFPGEIPAAEIPLLFQGAGLLVALPRYEGFGMTPLEAMACGIPVVASDTGHFREFCAPDVEEDAAGIIVPTEDADAAAAAILTILSNPLHRAKLAANARRRVLAEFSVAREAAGVSRIYEELWDNC